MDECSEYKQLQQKKIRNKAIIEANESTLNEMNICQRGYTEEQVLAAQENEAGKAINGLYDNHIFPMVNGVIFCIYYIISLIALPVTHSNSESFFVFFLGYLGILAIAVALRFVDKISKKNMNSKHPFFEDLNTFSNHASVFAYLLNSMGYMIIFLESKWFWVLYSIMVLLFIIALRVDVIVPWLKRRRTKKRGY